MAQKSRYTIVIDGLSSYTRSRDIKYEAERYGKVEAVERDARARCALVEFTRSDRCSLGTALLQSLRMAALLLHCCACPASLTPDVLTGNRPPGLSCFTLTFVGWCSRVLVLHAEGPQPPHLPAPWPAAAPSTRTPSRQPAPSQPETRPTSTPPHRQP
jgi:hypothetical protein